MQSVQELSDVFGIMFRSAQDNYSDFVELGQTQVISGELLEEKRLAMDTHAKRANMLFITAAVAAVATLVMIPFTDFEGYEVHHR